MSKKKFNDKKVSKYVLRRDYSKIEKNFDEPNLLNLQKKAFNHFIEVDLENTIKSIFPIKSIGGRYSLEYLGMKLDEPKRTEREARNEGKTYDRPLYVDLAIIDHESGEIKKSSSKSKKHFSNSDGIFFANIPMITEKGTFIVNGIEKFVISQIVRSPGAYILTKSQIKLSNSRKRIQEGYICEILPSKGTLFFIFISENKDFVQVMFRDAIGESTHTVSVTAFLKALGMNEKEILTIFGNNDLIKKSLANEIYNSKDIFDCEELLNFRKSINSSDFNRSYGVDTKLRDLYKAYSELKNEIEDKGSNKEREAKLEQITNDIISEKAAKDLVVNLSISTKSIDSRYKMSGKDITYQTIIYKHFFSVKNFDLLNAGRYKMNRKLRLTERLYQRVLAQDLTDSNGKVVIKKGELLQKQEIDLIKSLSAKENNLNYSHTVELNQKIAKIAGNVKYEKILVYQDNDSQKETIPIIGSNIFFNEPTLNISDILAITSYVIDLNYDIGFFDDIDHLGNKRLKLIDELLKTRAQAGLARIEKFINDKLAIADGANKSPEIEQEAEKKPMTVKSIINTKPFQISFKEFFNLHQLTQFLDQQNPLAELTNKRRISAMGPGGISREDPNLDIRDVHHSHYGKICPIETPEGMNIGLIMSLATFANTDENGFLVTPYRVVKNGVITNEIKWLTALVEDEYIIACSNLKVENNKFQEEKVLCRFRSSWEFFKPEEIDFIDISPKQVVSIAASSIPFLENDDANRALMGANMQRQATPLIAPIAPIVGTDSEYKIAHDSGMALVYNEDKEGTVSYVDGSLIKIKYGQNEKVYELTKFAKSNQNTCNNQVPIVSLGEKIQKGQTIADGPAISKGELALGQNVLVAFTTWGGYNYEDAIILSNRLFVEDIFTSIHIVEYSVECLKTKNGDEEITRDIPNVSESATQNLDEEGIIIVGADVKEGDVLVGKISPKGQVELTSEEKLLQAIFGDKSRNHKETSLKVPHGGEGTVAMVKRFKAEDDYELNADVIEQIKVYVVQKRKIQIGDKMAGRHGNKGIISKIVPVEDMPHMKDGTVIDIMLNPLGVPSRMNIGQIFELHLGIAMQRLALTKLLELYFDNKKAEDYSLWFGIQNELAEVLIKNVAKVINEKQIKNLADAKKRFTDFDFSIVLSRSGIPREQIIYKVATPVFEGINRNDLKEVMAEAGIDPVKNAPGMGYKGKFKLIDGRTGDYFDGDIAVGVMYMLKLDHMVDDKIHARAVGPYSKITQQPLGGKSQNGGQRFGEMEVWALEAYGAAHNLKELLTIKSDDVKGRNDTYNAIIKGKPIPDSGVPESFKLLTKQLQGLGLQVNISKDGETTKSGQPIFIDINEHISKNSQTSNFEEKEEIDFNNNGL
ncbi:MAG: DNA-directed RNA polymerase subunit beta [Malacoplasma sp.]|nr:DNA-directed RNA polymerase subunit beta [Malacoplasma sp.]